MDYKRRVLLSLAMLTIGPTFSHDLLDRGKQKGKQRYWQGAFYHREWKKEIDFAFPTYIHF